MDATDGDGVAAELHDELAVAVNTDDIALQASEHAGQDAELDVVIGKLHERLAQEGDVLGMGAGDLHEGAHHLVGNDGGATGTAVVDQMIQGISVAQEQLQLSGLALKEDEAADCGNLLLHNAFATLLLLAPDGVMDETLVGRRWILFVVGSHLRLERIHLLVVNEKVAPGYGHFFYT